MQAIEQLDVERFKAALTVDPLAPVLTDKQLARFEKRRERLLEYVASMVTKFGEAATPW